MKRTEGALLGKREGAALETTAALERTEEAVSRWTAGLAKTMLEYTVADYSERKARLGLSSHRTKF